MDLLSVVGQCDNGYACVYQNNLSWSSPTTPLPAEAHPRIVFENLFGEGGGAAERRDGAQEASQPAGFGDRGAGRPAEDAGAGRSQSRDAVSGDRSATWNGEFSRPKRRRRRIRCRTSIGPRRRSGVLRRSRPVDVRLADAGAAGGHHAGGHVSTRARSEQSDSIRRSAYPTRIIR